jgi:hypothetical protein
MRQTPVTDNDPWALNFAPLPGSGPGPRRQGFSTSPNPDTSETDARVRALEHAIKSLEKRIVGDGIRLGRFLFQSQEDLRIWITAHLANHRFGLFLDGVSIFDFLAQAHTDSQDNMAHLCNSQKNGFETVYE